MMKLLLCANNPFVIAKLRNLTKQLTYALSIDVCSDITTISTYLATTEEMMMLLDLAFDPDLSLVPKIQAQQPCTEIILLGEHEDFHSGIYEVSHCYFIIKSELERWFVPAINKAVKQLHERKKYIFLTQKNACISLCVDSILFLERKLRITLLHTADHVYTSSLPLSWFQDQLPEHFLLCHCSFLINLDQVRIYMRTEFLLTDTSRIPISRSHAVHVRKQWQQYMQLRSLSTGIAIENEEFAMYI